MLSVSPVFSLHQFVVSELHALSVYLGRVISPLQNGLDINHSRQDLGGHYSDGFQLVTARLSVPCMYEHAYRLCGLRSMRLTVLAALLFFAVLEAAHFIGGGSHEGEPAGALDTGADLSAALPVAASAIDAFPLSWWVDFAQTTFGANAEVTLSGTGRPAIVASWQRSSVFVPTVRVWD